MQRNGASDNGASYRQSINEAKQASYWPKTDITTHTRGNFKILPAPHSVTSSLTHSLTYAHTHTHTHTHACSQTCTQACTHTYI